MKPCEYIIYTSDQNNSVWCHVPQNRVDYISEDSSAFYSSEGVMLCDMGFFKKFSIQPRISEYGLFV